LIKELVPEIVYNKWKELGPYVNLDSVIENNKQRIRVYAKLYGNENVYNGWIDRETEDCDGYGVFVFKDGQIQEGYFNQSQL
jgi:hypothetical protein